MKRVIAIIFSVALIWGLTACAEQVDTSNSVAMPSVSSNQIITPSATPKEKNNTLSASPTIVAEPVDPNEKGTTSWNINNDGIAASKGDWIYYQWFGNESYDPKGGLYKIKIDGTEKEQIYQGSLFDINVVGDCVYFVSGSITVFGGSATRQGTSIKKVNTDGTNSTTIMELGSGDGTISDAFVVGEWIYYNYLMLGSDVSGFYRIKTDGTDQQKLLSYMVSGFDIVEDWIYYSPSNPDKGDEGIFKMKTDGTEMQLISPIKSLDRFTNIAVVDNWIIYTEDLNELYKVSTDGTDQQEIISNDDLVALNISEEWIYLTTKVSGGLSLQKIRIDGTDEQLLYSDMLMQNICVFGDRIYFESYNNNNDAIHIVGIIKTDGSNFQIIE